MKNLKTIFSLALLIFFLLSSNEIFAQGQAKDQENKKIETTKKVEQKTDSNSDQAMDYHDGNDEKKDKKENKGNAYEKTKGEIKGNKFANTKPEEARIRLEAQKGMAKAKINLGKEKSTAARAKIAAAKVELAKQIKEGKISEEEASQKDMAIKKAEKILTDLEATIQKVTEKVN